MDSAVKYGRKIAVCGRSMINMIENAKALGYINAPEDIFIDIDLIRNYNDEQLVIITTGSQGETMSALTRMAAGEHKKVTIYTKWFSNNFCKCNTRKWEACF